MPDNILAIDESKKLAQHEAVKDAVRNEVHSEIESKVQLTSSDQSAVAGIAGDLKQKMISEVGATEAEIGRAKVAARVSQVIDYLFYLVYGIISLELLLDLIGASNSSGFKSFLNAISAPLLAPFHKLMPSLSVGRSTFMISYLVAIVVYVLLHLAVNGLLRLLVQKKSTV